MLTHERLLGVLLYDAHSGVFTWRQPPKTSPRKEGETAGGAHDKGYWHIRIDGRIYKAHRLAWFYVHGRWPDGLVDHIDGNVGNNAIANLREGDRKLNSENIRKSHRDSKSQLLGATPNHKRWMAQISSGGQYRYLGTFDTPLEAHQAYLAAKRELHPGAPV